MEQAVGSYRIGLVGLLTLPLVACGAPDQAAVPEAPPLSAEAVRACEKFLADGARSGLIRGRPNGATIAVDERIWAELPMETKRTTLAALSCATFRQARPPGDAYVAAVGWRDGKRKLMLTRSGTI